MSLDLRQLHQGRRSRQLVVQHVLHHAVQLRDPVEIDGRRPYADREAAWAGSDPTESSTSVGVAET